MATTARAENEVIVGWCGQLFFAGDKPAANGVIGLREKFSAGAVKQRKMHLVRVQGWRDVAPQINVAPRIKRDLRAVMQRKASARSNRSDRALGLIRIGFIGGTPQQTKADRFVGSVADAGQRQRSVQADGYFRGLAQDACKRGIFKEAPGNAHRPDCMRRRWTNARFKYVKSAEHKIPWRCLTLGRYLNKRRPIGEVFHPAYRPQFSRRTQPTQ